MFGFSETYKEMNSIHGIQQGSNLSGQHNDRSRSFSLKSPNICLEMFDGLTKAAGCPWKLLHQEIPLSYGLPHVYISCIYGNLNAQVKSVNILMQLKLSASKNKEKRC